MPTSGIHIHFFIRVVSRASKPDGIIARLQFGLAGQRCRTMKKIADTIAWNLNIYDLHFISVIVTKKRVLTKLQSTIDTGPSLNTVSSRFTSICLLNCLLVSLSVCMKTRRLHFFPYKATAPALLFVVVFFAKGGKTSSKLKTPHLDDCCHVFCE